MCLISVGVNCQKLWSNLMRYQLLVIFLSEIWIFIRQVNKALLSFTFFHVSSKKFLRFNMSHDQLDFTKNFLIYPENDFNNSSAM